MARALCCVGRQALKVRRGGAWFGPITHLAVLKYQASVGLMADGVLGPLTIAKIVSDQSELAIQPKLPSTAITIAPFSAVFGIVVLLTYSCYYNPVDDVLH